MVVTSALNWPGAVGPIYASGMTPKYVDVSVLDGCVDDRHAAEGFEDGAVAALVPHLFGNFTRLPQMRSAAHRRGLPIIDDCAQAMGGILRYGCDPDFYSAAMTSSGNGSKHLGAGELGVLCTKNADLIEHVDLVSLSSSSRDHERVFSPMTYGYNYRPNVFSAAIALSRLPDLASQIEDRVSNSTYLWRSLARLPGLRPLFDESETANSFCVLPLRLVPSEIDLPEAACIRDRIVTLLKAEGVPMDVWLRKPVWEYMAFDRPSLDPAAFPNTDLLLSTICHVKEVAPPNDHRVMRLFAEAFEKIWEDMPALKDWLVRPS
jgi:dTDP-4-amino-4,6-dideoxygalactose transaminase